VQASPLSNSTTPTPTVQRTTPAQRVRARQVWKARGDKLAFLRFRRAALLHDELLAIQWRMQHAHGTAGKLGMLTKCLQPTKSRDRPPNAVAFEQRPKWPRSAPQPLTTHRSAHSLPRPRCGRRHTACTRCSSSISPPRAVTCTASPLFATS